MKVVALGPKLKKNCAKHVEGQQTVFTQLVISKADDDEDNCKHDEAHKLNGLAADCVD